MSNAEGKLNESCVWVFFCDSKSNPLPHDELERFCGFPPQRRLFRLGLCTVSQWLLRCTCLSGVMRGAPGAGFSASALFPQRYANKNIAHFTEADLLGSKLDF